MGEPKKPVTGPFLIKPNTESTMNKKQSSNNQGLHKIELTAEDHPMNQEAIGQIIFKEAYDILSEPIHITSIIP